MPTSRIWLLSHVKRALYCTIHRRNMSPSVVSGENGAGPTPAWVGGSFTFTTGTPTVTDVLVSGRINGPYVRHVVYISGAWHRA